MKHSFRTRHHLRRQEVALVGSQQVQAQDPEPVRRCRTERRTGSRGREKDEMTTETGAEVRAKTRTGIGTGMRAETGTETRTERKVEGRESPRMYKVIVM